MQPVSLALLCGATASAAAASTTARHNQLLRRGTAADPVSAVPTDAFADATADPGDADPDAVIREKARALLKGPTYDWQKNLGGALWEYGACPDSVAWGAPYFGARWPLQTGYVTWFDALDTGEDGETAYVPRSVFAVLNQRYLSQFASEADAQACAPPAKAPIDLRLVRGAGQGGEPVLVSMQEGASFCVHLRMKNDGPRAETKVFCMSDRKDRRDWLDYVQDVVKNNAEDRTFATMEAHGRQPSPDAIARGMFPQPPRTICVGAPPAGPCMTSVPQVAANADGTDEVSGTESSPTPQTSLDAVKLSPARWLASFPIRARDEQTWTVSVATDASSSEAVDTVHICNQAAAPAGAAGVEMCLTALDKMDTTGAIQLPPRRYTSCPGGNLRCFNVEKVRLGMLPTAEDSHACHAACKGNDKCKGWVYTRPEATGTGFAKCCLKARDVSSTCESNRCCDAHMKTELKRGLVISDSAEVPRISGVLKLAPKVSFCFQPCVVVVVK